MAVGQIHTIESDKVRAKFTEDATYGVVLTSIENLDDGSIVTFPVGPLFRVITRAVAAADTFTTFESDDATSVGVQGTGYDSGVFHYGSQYESPALGGRTYFEANFYFTNALGSNDFRVIFTASVLDSQPDRVLFALYLDPTFDGGIGTNAFFWCAPILLKITPYTDDHYLIGMNGGLVTRDPKVDLVTTVTYKFTTKVGFEPETATSAFADRMEAFYPQSLSTAIAAYGDLSSTGTTIYAHDALHFNGRRLRDTYLGGVILLEHEGLVENGIAASNGWGSPGDGELRRVETYVRVFKRTGDVLGEDVGLDYGKWARSSVEGQAILQGKPKDRADMATLQTTPLFRTYYDQDDEDENGITEEIAEELREAFDFLEGHPLYRMLEDLFLFSAQDNSATHPGLVGDAQHDLWDLEVDPEKVVYATELDGADYELYTGGHVEPRRPAPYDGNGYWDSDAMSASRVMNHFEAANPGAYKTTDQCLKRTGTVASRTFDGTYTRVTLTTHISDSTLWSLSSFYSDTTAGVNHATHSAHTGWMQKVGGAYAFVMEQQGQADFAATPSIIYVAGDRTATILVADAIEMYFGKSLSSSVSGDNKPEHFIPGYDLGATGTIASVKTTSLCAMDDDIGNGTVPAVAGWGVRYVERFDTLARPWLVTILHLHTWDNCICWGTHGGETPGSNEQILAWRRILTHLCETYEGEDFQIYSDFGPHDWELGLVYGYARTQVRRDLTSVGGSWGASPFFQTAWGQYMRFGGYTTAGEAHITNFGSPTATDTIRDFYEEGATAPGLREAMATDFALGKLPSYGVSPEVGHTSGTTPSGKTAYTPFNDVEYGMTVPTSFSALMARLLQFHNEFDGVNVFGQRVRSLLRVETTTIASNQSGLITLEGHEIGGTELGPERSPLMHWLLRDHRNPRKLVAIFLNDTQARRGGSYRFDPDLYVDVLPIIPVDDDDNALAAYRLTKFTVNYDGVESEDQGQFLGEKIISLSLDAGEMVAFVFDLSSGLRFRYAYDDQALREVPIQSDLTRIRVEDIHGAGAKLIVGFANELPDQDYKIASMDLRIFKQGQSEAT